MALLSSSLFRNGTRRRRWIFVLPRSVHEALTLEPADVVPPGIPYRIDQDELRMQSTFEYD